jgi:flavodoxin
MSRALVVYYSWTGHTRQIAEAVAGALGADLEEIREVHPRTGRFAFLRSLWEALWRKQVPIKASEKDPSAYDLIVLGTPVWAARMASPTYAYIERYGHRFARIALFCTEGGANGDKALAQMANLCRKQPAGTLIVMEKDLKSGTWRERVADFVKSLH